MIADAGVIVVAGSGGILAGLFAGFVAAAIRRRRRDHAPRDRIQ